MEKDKKVKEKVPGIGDKELMEQMNKLMRVNEAKTDQMILDSVVVLLNSMMTAPVIKAIPVFDHNEIEKLKKVLFNVLNKYNG